jgi:hypothetical protein
MLTPASFILEMIGAFQKDTKIVFAITGAIGEGLTILCLIISRKKDYNY